MKDFLKNIFWIAIVAFFVFILLNEFQSRYNNEPPHYRLQYDEALNQSSDFNGIIIGNSKATHSIRPSKLDTLDIRFYNLSLNGASQAFYLEWYKDIFMSNHPKIDYWIISADYFFLSGSGRRLANDSEYFPDSSFWNILLKGNGYNRKGVILDRFPVLKYRSRIMESFNDFQGRYRFLIEEYDRGYISLERIDDADVDLSATRDLKPKLTIENQEKFKTLINTLSEAGGRIVFVIPPEYNLEQSQYKDHKAFLTKLSEERKIPLYDFNDQIYSQSLGKRENFCDYNHLNEKGSLLLSDFLRRELYKNDGIMIDKKH